MAELNPIEMPSSTNNFSDLPFVHRNEACRRLDHCLASGRPELVAVIGRRRVGKTYLVRHFLAKQICFELSGSRDAPLDEQLDNFVTALAQRIHVRPEKPKNWSSAFEMLIQFLEPKLKKKGRQVIFFDELPWLAGRNSRFLSAFEFFWNQWASQQPNLIVVVCGSSASWMIDKVLNNRGGFHNRVTQRIHLNPFSLGETLEYAKLLKLPFDQKQIAELYMATGGIPYYLSQIPRGVSVSQAIQELIFDPTAPLRNEFEELYASLFDNHQRHLEIVKALAKKASGLTRNDLVDQTKFPSGGNITKILNELEQSGFILRTVPYGRTHRDAIYRLIDEFSLFHLRWVKKKGVVDWAQTRSTPAWQAWSGYAFENLCWRHVNQIKKALGISGVQCEISAWRHQPKPGTEETGAQIDLLIHRKDDMINICEMKWSDTLFRINKSYANQLRLKREVFREITGAKSGLLLTMVTHEGVMENPYQSDLVDSEVLLQDLFEK